MANKKTEVKTGKTPFAVVEAYNTVRTNLLFLLSQQKGKVITVSSAIAAEGKSTTTINVAVAFSQLGSKTLIIDSDMRKASIHRKLHISNTTGLSNALVGFCTADEAITNINPNLDVMTAGPTPPNPSELLASEAFDKLVENLKEKYDHIIIDTPPINVVSDALVVAPRTNGVLMVVKGRYTYHDEFKAAISSLEFSKIRLLGVVLNSIDSGKSSKYKYKYKYSKYRKYYNYRNYENSAYINKN